MPERQADTFEDRALAVARFIHVEVYELSVEEFMDDQCDCDMLAHKVMLLAGAPS